MWCCLAAIRTCVGCSEGCQALSQLDQLEHSGDTPDHELAEKRTDGLHGAGVMLFWKGTKAEDGLLL